MFTIVIHDPKIERTGSISGSLSDKYTKTPLIGANILLVNTLLGAATNEAGEFFIENVPVGSYTIQFSFTGNDLPVGYAANFWFRV
jgi:hypothetical protein